MPAVAGAVMLAKVHTQAKRPRNAPTLTMRSPGYETCHSVSGFRPRGGRAQPLAAGILAGPYPGQALERTR
jgi:hypothetical protein